MAWFGWRGRGRGGWVGPWPGRGPFSYLPPWQRPGWLFGRGSCWWLFGNPWAYRFYAPYYAPYTPYYTPWSWFYRPYLPWLPYGYPYY